MNTSTMIDIDFIRRTVTPTPDNASSEDQVIMTNVMSQFERENEKPKRWFHSKNRSIAEIDANAGETRDIEFEDDDDDDDDDSSDHRWDTEGMILY